MNKIKTLQVLCGLLLVINIGLISFMAFKKGPPGRNGKRATNHLKETFGFDDSQMAKFADFRDAHKNRGREISDQLSEISKAYYTTINDSISKKILLDSVVTLSKEIYLNNERHFSDLRSLCNNDQLKNINGFIDNLMKRNRGPQGKRDLRPQGKRGEKRKRRK